MPQAPLPPAQRERQEIAHRNALRLLRLVNTLLDFSRIEAGRIDASYEPTDLGGVDHGSRERVPVGRREGRPRAGRRLPAAARTGLRRPGHVGEDRPQPALERVQVHVRRSRSLWKLRVARRSRRARRRRHRRRHSGSRPAAHVRAVPSRQGRAGADPRRHRHRPGARAGAGAAARRRRSRSTSQSKDAGTTFTVSIRTGTSHLPPDRDRGAAPADVRRASARVPSWRKRFAGCRRRRDADAAGDSIRSRPRRPEPASNAPACSSRTTTRTCATIVGRILGQSYRVEAVADGEAALDRIRASAPDLVVADVMMPKLDGFGLLAAIRGDERTRSHAGVLLSARAGEEARIEGLQAGADDIWSSRSAPARLLATRRLAAASWPDDAARSPSARSRLPGRHRRLGGRRHPRQGSRTASFNRATRRQSGCSAIQPTSSIGRRSGC